MKPMSLKSLDPETGDATIFDQDGNEQHGFVGVRPGGMLVFVPVDHRRQTTMSEPAEASPTEDQLHEVTQPGEGRTAIPAGVGAGVEGPNQAGEGGSNP